MYVSNDMTPAATGQPRERLLRLGPAALDDDELVSLILGSGVRGRSVKTVAREVVSLLDSRNALPSAEDLCRIHGLGIAKSAALGASFELARRLLCPKRHKIRSPSDLLPLLERFVERKQEHFLAASLNGAHEVTAVRVVSVGLVNRTMVHAREVFADPLVDRAAAVMLAHNHPSGATEPSAEDDEVTRRVVAAGETLGIPVLDHIIFSRTGYFSYVDNDRL